MIKSDEIAGRIDTMLKEIKPSLQFKADAHLRKDLKLDSLDVISLIFDLEREFGIKIPEKDVEEKELLNLSHLVQYIEGKTG
jgi:acyl carrier protein